MGTVDCAVQHTPSLQVWTDARGPKAQDISNIAQRGASANVLGVALTWSFADADVLKLRSFDERHMVNNARAFTKLVMKAEVLMGSISTSAAPDSTGWTPRGVAMAVQSRVNAQKQGEILVDGTQCEAHQCVRGCSIQDLANLAWASATLGKCSEAVVHAIVTEAIQCITGSPARTSSIVVWTPVTMRIHCEATLGATPRQAAVVSHGLDVRALVNIE